MKVSLKKEIEVKPIMGNMEAGTLGRILGSEYGESNGIVVRTDIPVKGWFNLNLSCFWSEQLYPDVAKWSVGILPGTEVIELRNEE